MIYYETLFKVISLTATPALHTVDIGNKKMAMGNIYTGIEPVSFPFDDDN
jgi:hypothetical protein